MVGERANGRLVLQHASPQSHYIYGRDARMVNE